METRVKNKITFHRYKEEEFFLLIEALSKSKAEICFVEKKLTSPSDDAGILIQSSLNYFLLFCFIEGFTIHSLKVSSLLGSLFEKIRVLKHTAEEKSIPVFLAETSAVENNIPMVILRESFLPELTSNYRKSFISWIKSLPKEEVKITYILEEDKITFLVNYKDKIYRADIDQSPGYKINDFLLDFRGIDIWNLSERI